MATSLTVDFTKVPEHEHMVNDPDDDRPHDSRGKLLTPKQIRARARRRAKRLSRDIISDEEMQHLYNKPVEEWDLEELAAGRPKNAKGHFKGPQPKWITRDIHEAAMDQYKVAVKTSMRVTTVDALTILNKIINDEERDERGKPLVSASTKLDAAKFLIEHVVGKPTQRIESDVSVKLQGILASVMVNPNDERTGFDLAHLPGVTMQIGTKPEEDEDFDLEEDSGG